MFIYYSQFYSCEIFSQVTKFTDWQNIDVYQRFQMPNSSWNASNTSFEIKLRVRIPKTMQFLHNKISKFLFFVKIHHWIRKLDKHRLRHTHKTQYHIRKKNYKAMFVEQIFYDLINLILYKL